jgi:hypothetical protein
MRHSTVVVVSPLLFASAAVASPPKPLSIIGPDTQIQPPATVCVNYGGPPSTLTATGGTPPYSWSIDPQSADQLPPGLSLDVLGQTAQITGIPTLPETGRGGNHSYTITFKVTDSSIGPLSSTRTYTMGVLDPDGPFVIVGNGAQSFPLGAVTSGSWYSALVYGSNPVPPTWTPIYWTLAVAPVGITIVGYDGGNPTSGLTAHLHSDGSLVSGQYDVTVRAEDSPPCLSPTNPGVRHRAEFTVIVTIVGP